MTRQQIIDRVKANIGRKDRDAITSAAIDEALVQAGQMHEFKSMQVSEDLPLTASTEKVTLPEKLFQIVEVRLLDGLSSYRIDLREKVWVTRHYPNSQQIVPGRPIFAYEEAGQLVILPIPDRDYSATVTFIRLPLLEDEADLQPAELASYVIAWATSEAYRSTEQFDNSAVWEKRANSLLLIAIKGDRERGATHIADQYPDDLSRSSVDPYRDPFYGVKNTD